VPVVIVLCFLLRTGEKGRWVKIPRGPAAVKEESSCNATVYIKREGMEDDDA